MGTVSGGTDELDQAVLLSVLSDVENGDFSVRMPLGWTGVAGKIADRLNRLIAANHTLAVELARVSRAVGKEGRLSQRVRLRGADQVWFAGIESVNRLIEDLVRPTSEMQRVIGAVADGDLSQRITADVHGEMLELKNTVNAMVDQLNRFAAEVTPVAREVGVEGKLGGQAQSTEVVGVWKDLTNNVNRLIRDLRETARQNTQQDWLKTNLERFTRMLQGQRDIASVSKMILSELAPLVSAQHGVFYSLVESEDGEPVLRFQAGYGYSERRHLANELPLGEGLIAQCAQRQERILLTHVPGDYIRINSGLGELPPLNIIVLPILFEGSVRAVVELASFSLFSDTHQAFLDQLTESIGLALTTIEANTLTENLLQQSQSRAQELQSCQEDLRSSNEDLARQARRLVEQNMELEAKHQEVELAKRLVEEKAEQLAASSAFRSEFFSNMSHELRTPLNSLLILTGELKVNPERNLTDAQVQYASIIQSSGSDLLRLLNEVLDLAEVEAGTVTLDITELPLVELRAALEREFGNLAAQSGVSFSVELAPGVSASIATDSARLRQVLKNLLDNAFRFTEQGEVKVWVSRCKRGWSPTNRGLAQAEGVTAFSVSDTGIGIAEELQTRISEAFAQADGTTARKYGRTGLGLSISRQLVRLLGGEMGLNSTLGKGSTFTVYLPSGREGDAVKMVASASTQPAPSRLSNEASCSALAGKKVLVIDDDFRNIFAITALLERGELEVISADSGTEGITVLERTPDIDVVLVDIMMPVMNGYDTMRAMRLLPGSEHVLIIALTAKTGAGERERCIEAGASEYIPKPVENGPDFLVALDACVALAAPGTGVLG
jgi:signal transduction histidine kinase/HAMP domain-containing protein/ActR/RegA family two-component response regulator